jgi:hypothetical protein
MFKEAIQQWLSALANDDYKKADETFPAVINHSLQNTINTLKPAIITSLNDNAEKIAAESIKGENKSTQKA